jgi:LuxR family maltose regulon positive regulatory protein
LALIDEFAAQSGQPLPLKALICARLSNVLQAWNEMEKALYYAQEAVRLCELWGQADISVIAYGRLSGALASSGDLEGALEMQHKARRVASDVSPWYGALQEGWEALLRLAQGDLAAARRWVDQSGLSPDDAFERDGEGQYLSLARILIAQGKLDQAWRLLARLRETAEQAGMIPWVISVLIQQALILDQQGKPDEALATLERALTLAEPEGFIRIFISLDSPLAALLRKAVTKGIATNYARRLLRELDKELKPMPLTVQPPSSSLIEPLSERELEVLRLLNSRLSSPEIAQALVISKNTVRTHIAHIYDKLGVHSRADALERARELDLL